MKNNIEFIERYGESLQEQDSKLLLECLDKVENKEVYYKIRGLIMKLGRTLEMCDYLKSVKVSRNHDNDKIIITNFICLAEAVYKEIKTTQKCKLQLIRGFLKPVRESIQHKIRGNRYRDNDSLCSKLDIFDYAETLYYIRNDYLHNGDFLGVCFDSKNSPSYHYMHSMFSFQYKNSPKIHQGSMECSITLEEFIKIFTSAFITNMQIIGKN